MLWSCRFSIEIWKETERQINERFRTNIKKQNRKYSVEIQNTCAKYNVEVIKFMQKRFNILSFFCSHSMFTKRKRKRKREWERERDKKIVYF